MTWVVPLALGGFAVLLMVTFTMLSARKRHHAHAAPAAVVGPRVLIHDINDDRCTGCDACVAVCPTNVLDLVSNKSRVLRFEDCIQCEACMFACPTEALVMFPEGGVPPPLKVPEIDENFQTAIPGQYLIGEVAGKPLVKSAANLGRAVIEHMMTMGLRPGALGRGGGVVDVAIVGSGPGGLSAALSCIARGLSYVVLEKEQLIASTIARYPKGKLVMAEPYDTQNVSMLPVFDSSKEQLIPIWKELIERVGMVINQGESVETIAKGGDGAFDVRSTVAGYRAQRVVLSIGTRGKPRTLQVPGENLPKIFNLLDDPDDWRGKNVLVVGGGDSAVEAALALSDAGARVMISYRGKGFNRAAPKNKATIEAYAAEGRIKAKLGSQVLQFEGDSVTLALADNTQKRYPNDGAFVLIGADPPVQWLEKMGIHFVQRPHSYQMGKTDDIVRRLVARAAECPEDAARAAAQILGGSTGKEPAFIAPPRPPSIPARRPTSNGEVSGPRKWLRSATSIFSMGKSGIHHLNAPPPPPPARSADKTGKRKQLDAPMPLSEFAARGREGNASRASTNHHTHTGHGRRDALTAGERTRILRMLRDEGGRMADEDSQVHFGAPPAPKGYDFDFDDNEVAPPPPSSMRPDVPAKPAVVVGLAAARRQKRQSASPPPPPAQQRPQPGRSPKPAQQQASNRPRAPLPKPFDGDLPTRTVNDAELIAQVRNAAGPGRIPGPFDDQPTRLGNVDARLLDQDVIDEALATMPGDRFIGAVTEPQSALGMSPLEDNSDEATRLSSIDSLRPSAPPAPAVPQKSQKGPPKGPPGKKGPPSTDERTRLVDVRNDPSMSDIDWDID